MGYFKPKNQKKKKEKEKKNATKKNTKKNGSNRASVPPSDASSAASRVVQSASRRASSRRSPQTLPGTYPNGSSSSSSSSNSEGVDYSQPNNARLDSPSVPHNTSISRGLQNPMKLTTTSSLSFLRHPRDDDMDENNSAVEEEEEEGEEEEDGEREESVDNDDGRSVASRTSSASRARSVDSLALLFQPNRTSSSSDYYNQMNERDDSLPTKAPASGNSGLASSNSNSNSNSNNRSIRATDNSNAAAPVRGMQPRSRRTATAVDSLLLLGAGNVAHTCAGINHNMQYFANCSLEKMVAELNLVNGVWRSRECLGEVMCPPTTRIVRCSKCANHVKHHKRKLNEWQPSTEGHSILSPRGKHARTGFWQGPEDVVSDVQAAYQALQSQDEPQQQPQQQEQQLLRIAKHLALEPELLHQVNPVLVTNTLVVCFCPTESDLLHCKKCLHYEIKQRRHNNNLFCTPCVKRLRYNSIKEEPTVAAAEPDTANNSTTPTLTTPSIASTLSTDARSRVNIGLLTREQLEERFRHKAAISKQLNRSLIRSHAQHQLHAISSATSVDTHAVSSVQGHVRKTALAVVDALCSKKGEAQMREVLQSILVADIQSHLKKKEIDPEEVEQMAAEQLAACSDTLEYIVGEMKGLASKLNGTQKQHRFSPTTMQFAIALFLRSPKGYEEASRVSPLPSVSSLVKIKQAMRTKDGLCPKLYLNARDRNGGQVCNGVVVLDEMKIEEGVVFNASDNCISGFTDDAVDLEKLAAKLIHSTGRGTTADTNTTSATTNISVVDDTTITDTTSADFGPGTGTVQYVNQYLFRSADKKEVATPLSFFYAKGPTAGAVMLQQLLGVIRACELIQFRVHGVCADAGGGNASLFSLIRSVGPTARSDSAVLPDGYVSCQHPFDPERSIWFTHCATHLLKAKRNLLHASKPGGARALQWNSMDISWVAVTDAYSRDLARHPAAPRTDLTSASIELDGWSSMNVRAAKSVFSDRTILEGIDHAAGILNVHNIPEPSQQVRAAFLTSTKMKNHHIGLLSYIVEFLLTLPWPTATVSANPLPTLLYQCKINELFNSLFLCGSERITRDNIGSNTTPVSTANLVEEWLVMQYTGMCKILLSCIAINKPQQIHRSLQAYIRTCKQTTAAPLSILQPSHIDILIQCVYEVMQATFVDILRASASTNSAASTTDTAATGDSSLDRKLTSAEMDFEFISFIGFAVYDLTRVVKQHQHTPRRTSLLAVLNGLRGTQQLLQGHVPTGIAIADRGNYTYPHVALLDWGMLLLRQIRTLVNVKNMGNFCMQTAYQSLKQDTDLHRLFAEGFAAAGLVPDLLPIGVSVEAIEDALTLKVYHARCGAIFSQLSSVLRTKSSVSLRGGLKALSALKKSVKKNAKKGAKNKKKITGSGNAGDDQLGLSVCVEMEEELLHT